MSDLLELSAEYREAGLACRERLKLKREQLRGCGGLYEELELRRSMTMLAAMSRDCMEISRYLKDYWERRKELEDAERKKT